ncbi:SpoIIE family protein phosphatase [Streptomyces marincola]|uniref:PAS sensor protein n=1 Tax=Streptomyces marincola TaxID=2878388 RepID=A0A1W7CT45_9ACTN|nr:SpoIIE family protein phosphatase [Streptomyces marincola]ARQ67879.1 PAS sensor protein [Streptomyces marincola]
MTADPERPQQEDPSPVEAVGRIPLAVVVVDGAGLVTHWSTGARRLFGPAREQAVGRPAAEIMPVSGIVDRDPGPDAAPADPWPGTPDDGGPLDPDTRVEIIFGAETTELTQPTAGRFWTRDPEPNGAARDVLWWIYPLHGPGAARVLVLAADGSRIEAAGPGRKERLVPGFAPHTEFAEADRLAAELPDILPGMSTRDSARIAARVLELGYPVLDISHHARLPVSPDWGVPLRVRRRDALRRAVERARAAHDEETAAAAEAELASDLEYAAVRERLEFLNEVSGRIGSSLDLARTIREVSAAVVPRFTDVAGTYLREQVVAGEGFPDGPPDTRTLWHRVAVEHNDEPGRWDDVIPVGESMPFPEHTPFFRCMSTGQPVLVPRVTEEMGHAIAAQFEKRDIRPLITHRSMLIVPLKARQVVLGFMILLRHAERPEFNDMDRVTGAELAARAGLVLDNARMYTLQENVADTLQDSMLPRVQPRMAGCDVATRYLPGTSLGRVGGDWFDTIRLPGCRTALVVGDVMGHGLNSAAMMGQLRTAVQTMAALGTEPAQLLRGLDDLAQRLGDHYLATCLYAVYDPVRSVLRLANAGHIPPVLVAAADGTGRLLDLPTGAPIGVGRVPFTTVEVPVEPGDRLVMCTDGLVEVRGQDIGVGLAALCESAAHPAAAMDDACDAVIRALAAATAPEDRKDDVALLMARLAGIPPGDVAHWQLDAHPAAVPRARRLVRDRLRDWGLSFAADTAELLASELVTNAVRHAGPGPIGLRLVRADALLCEVTDGSPALPVLREARASDAAGRGLNVVGRLARAWGSHAGGPGKTVWFEQSLTRPGSGARGAA